MGVMTLQAGRVREQRGDHDLHNDAVTVESYQEARRKIDDAQAGVLAVQRKVKEFERRIADRIAAHNPANGATHYSISAREQDTEQLAKLQARCRELEAQRDKLYNTIQTYESGNATRQYQQAVSRLRSIAATAAPHAAKAVAALKGLVGALDALTEAYSKFMRVQDGDLRSARRQLESLGVPAPKALPIFAVTPQQILGWLSAKYRLNPNARGSAQSIEEAFPLGEEAASATADDGPIEDVESVGSDEDWPS